MSGQRRGKWQYDSTTGWRLDGTDLVLDFDPLDRSGDLQGAYLLYRCSSDGTGEYIAAIDHYIDGAMEYVERHLSEYANNQEQANR